MIFLPKEYEVSIPGVKRLVDDIEADLFTITSRVNGNPELADFKRQVESVKKRIAELRKYMGA